MFYYLEVNIFIEQTYLLVMMLFVFQLYSDSALTSRAEDNDPPGMFNSIDASFQMRLKELEEKQEVWNKHQ